eukprot:1804966-Rhodomonas_salina.2
MRRSRSEPEQEQRQAGAPATDRPPRPRKAGDRKLSQGGVLRRGLRRIARIDTVTAVTVGAVAGPSIAGAGVVVEDGAGAALPALPGPLAPRQCLRQLQLHRPQVRAGLVVVQQHASVCVCVRVCVCACVCARAHVCARVRPLVHTMYFECAVACAHCVLQWARSMVHCICTRCSRG